MQLFLHILAHGGAGVDVSRGPASWHELWRAWGAEPLSIMGLVLSAWLYIVGLQRTWRASGIGHGIKRWEAACFAAAWLALFIALVSPLHPWGQVLFSAHMTQHEILMLVAAPLMVLSRPMLAMLRALPTDWSQALARESNTDSWQRIWTTLTTPLVTWIIHFIVLWTWHVPVFFEATLHSELVHAFQHISFLASALLFWWALIQSRRAAINYGLAVLYMFTTALHSGLLGAMLTFAGRAWYAGYEHTTQSWGLTPLEDQQLGGLVMWVPACTVYVIAGVALIAGWMRESERRVLRYEQLMMNQGSL
jgi:putative membrane protein